MWEAIGSLERSGTSDVVKENALTEAVNRKRAPTDYTAYLPSLDSLGPGVYRSWNVGEHREALDVVC